MQFYHYLLWFLDHIVYVTGILENLELVISSAFFDSEFQFYG